MTALNVALTGYLIIGILLAGMFLAFVLFALSQSWVDEGDPDGPDSIAERRMIRAELRQSLDNLPGKDSQGAAVVFACLLVVAWPWAVVFITRRINRKD